METISSYEQSAKDFLNKAGINFKAQYIDDCVNELWDETHARSRYCVTFSRLITNTAGISKRRKFSLIFWQSLNNAGELPRAYDVLSCITKSDLGNFIEFCSDFGYDPDSPRAERFYRGVVAEWKKVRDFFDEAELEILREIN